MFTGRLADTLSRLANFLLGNSSGQEDASTTWTEPARPTTWKEVNRVPTWTEANRSNTWSAPTMATLVKRAAEVRTYTMDLSNLPEISGGDTVSAISSVTSAALSPPGASALTLTSQAVAAGNKGATVKIAAGQDGATYLLTFTVTTAAGYTLVGIGYLYVDDR